MMWKKPELVQASWIWAAIAFRSSRLVEKDRDMSSSGTVKGRIWLDFVVVDAPLASRESRYA